MKASKNRSLGASGGSTGRSQELMQHTKPGFSHCLLLSIWNCGLHDISEIRVLLVSKILEGELGPFGFVFYQCRLFLSVLVSQDHEECR